MPFLIAFIVIAVGVLPWIVIFLMTMLMPAAHTPAVRQASFPISIEYALGDETFVRTDTLNINFEGIARMIGESERRWGWHFASNNGRRTGMFSILQTDRVLVGYTFPSSEYLMGMREYGRSPFAHQELYSVTHNCSNLVSPARPMRTSSRYSDGVRIRTYYFNTIEELFKELPLNYDITLVSWQPPIPINNWGFRPSWIVLLIGAVVTSIIIFIRKRKSLLARFDDENKLLETSQSRHLRPPEKGED